MKKILITLLCLFAFTLKADFLEKMQAIDLLLQKGSYKEALNEGKALLNSEISSEDKLALQNLLTKIEEKISSENSTNVQNNTGEINFTTEEEMISEETSSSGTVSYLGDEVNDASKYQEYLNLEKEVLASKNSENIYALMNIYMRSGLYERAMKLGQKDSDIRNIYLSAFAARLIGKYDIAIKQYGRVLNKDSKHLGALLGMGLSYRAKKDSSSARKYLQSYLNNGGTNKNVANAINNLK